MPLRIDDSSSDNEDGPRYVLVENGTNCGKSLMVDTLESREFSVKDDNKGGARKGKRDHLGPTWGCTQKPTTKCRATLMFRNGMWKHGVNAHICPPIYKPIKARTTKRDMKAAVKKNKFEPVKKVYEQQLVGIPAAEVALLLPNEKNMLARLRHAKKLDFPGEPKDLQFVMDLAFIRNSADIPDDFLQEDIIMPNGRRHLIFGSGFMLSLLGNANTWWVDATFKIVKLPFKQLFAVHVFITHGECLKQVTVAYVLMSGKNTSDYEAVFKALKDKCGTVKVSTVVADFESATWNAVNNVFQGAVKMKGCNFHLCQAIFKKIKNLKLYEAYNNEPPTRAFCKKLMSLAMLPANKIEQTFVDLTIQEQLSPKLSELADYFEKNWMKHSVFTPESWSWYNEPIRTNNDAEGYHNRLNQRTEGSKVQLYRLMGVFAYEAKMHVEYTYYQVATDRLSRKISKKQSDKQRNLYRLWGKYHKKLLNERDLLNAIYEYSDPEYAREDFGVFDNGANV